MNAQHKPHWQFDDGGRAASGRRGHAGDCVCRAIAIASGRPYAEIYARLAEGMGTQRKSKHYKKQVRSARNGINVRRKWFKDYMTELGAIWTPTSSIGEGAAPIRKIPQQGRLVLQMRKHYAAYIDGVLRDTYDRTYGNAGHRVFGYWEFPAHNEGNTE